VPEFVAIDLETTGLDAKRDRIIEVGAVKFAGGKVVDECSYLVNPGMRIPPLITQLTNIRQEDVETAPPFKDIAGNICAFIGPLPVCGHQVQFDIGFFNEELHRLGMDRLRNEWLDSAVISRVILTHLPGYSLSQVASAAGIELRSAHRALDDARASGLIAVELVPRFAEIHPSIRHMMARFAPPSFLKTLLFQSCGKQGPTGAPAGKDLEAVPRRLPVPDETVAVDEKEVERFFSDGGALSTLMGGFAQRPPQAQMALAVAQTLNSRGYLIAEAGTGVGKSLAYLVPAALWALSNNTRVMVSSYTRNIGDQLVKRDLPLIRRLLGDTFRFSVLKGRTNYLCVNKWRRLLAGEHGNLSPRERMAILPLLRWAEETTSGDIEEQNQFNRRWFAKVWGLVSAEAHDCDGWRCAHSDECFLQRARIRAQGSHVVVINHALFFSDICAETSFLGRIGPVVFDEAHHLQACGHRYLRVELDTNRVNRFLELCDSLLKVLQKEGGGDDDGRDKIKAFKAAVKRIRKSAHGFLAGCDAWVQRTYPENGQAYQIAYRESPFDAAGRVYADFEADIAELQDAAISLQKKWREHDDGKSDVPADIAACVERISQLKADSAYLAAGRTDDHVFWIEGDRGKGWAKLCGVPLDIGELLSGIWGVRTGPVVFTSATLAVCGSIDYFREKVGLTSRLGADMVFERFGSPFSSSQFLRLALDCAMDPGGEEYAGYVGATIERLLQAFDKNILVLFTSNAMLEAVYDSVRGSDGLPEGATVFAQHISGSRQVMLEQFKNARRAVLLGADSFWEGIDVPGGECEIVVVPRLPFLVPTHPLTLALAEKYKERYGDSFRSYSVPEALIRFRQGAGRLIRTASDRGALIVLDRRIIHKNYGTMFVEALDGEFIFCTNADEVLGHMHDFFGSANASQER
jgi:predicted DnaQ family exonuclease/DinG family helicase